MAKVVFYSIPAHGHTNPTLPVVAKLVEKGEQVTYYSTPEFKDKITAAGAEFKEYTYMKNFDTSASGKNLAVLFHLLSKAAQTMLPDLLSEINDIRPDYIIHDSIAIWGRCAADIKKLPAVSSVSTFAYSSKNQNLFNTLKFIKKSGYAGIMKMKNAYDIQKKMHQEYGTKPLHFVDSMMNEENLNIIYTSRLFQPHQEYYDPGRYQFTGPSIETRKNDTDRTDYSSMKHPLIYVSMGTVWNEHFDIRLIIDSLKIFNGTVVISCRNYKKPAGSPDNILIKEHVNQLEILKYCDVFLTHGGMNSVNEGLYNEVPLCIYPFQSEQDEVAKRVVDTGCGLKLKKMNEHEIRKNINRILSSSKYKGNCSKISASFKEAGGSDKAVEVILDYIKNGKLNA